MIQGDYRRQLAQMNPDNLVNLKLTISIADLFDISNFYRGTKKHFKITPLYSFFHMTDARR